MSERGRKIALGKIKKRLYRKGFVNFSQNKKTSVKTSDDFSKEWENIVNSKNLQKDLTKHFLYLADSPGFESVVHKIFEHVKKAKINGKSKIKKRTDIRDNTKIRSYPS